MKNDNIAQQLTDTRNAKADAHTKYLTACDDYRQAVLDADAAGWTATEIGRHLDISRQAVDNVLGSAKTATHAGDGTRYKQARRRKQVDEPAVDAA